MLTEKQHQEWKKDLEELHDLEAENKQLKIEFEAAKKLCQIYFEIAEVFIPEDEIRERREEKIRQALNKAAGQTSDGAS